MTTTPRPDIDPMPEDMRAWARGDDLRSVLDRPARPVSGAAVLMAGVAISLIVAALIGRIVEALG